MIPAIATYEAQCVAFRVFLKQILGFLRWIEGETGFPFIDCFMRELKVTGYCNHMGRETAGWFLIADLQLDWRMAAEWFESVLSLGRCQTGVGGTPDPVINGVIAPISRFFVSPQLPIYRGYNPIYSW